MTLSPEAEEALGRLATFGIRPGLETSRRLLHALGNPHLEYEVVLVAGTNGKGTTSALLAAMATAAGYRTGLYTSPHLETVEERIRIDGGSISPWQFGRDLLEVVAVAERVLEGPATYFEVLTALAWLHFARHEVQVAIVEVGLGGRLDATNICSPTLSVITPVALDHERHLGASLAEIAGEKAGILRSGCPTVAAVEGIAMGAVRDVAVHLGSELIILSDRLVEISSQVRAASSQTVLLTTTQDHYELELRLLGRHQVDNLALAVVAAEELGKQGFQDLGAGAIVRGVGSCTWPGRLETIELAGDRVVLLDGAHNPHAAQALRLALDRLSMKWTLVFGVLDDKSVAGILPCLAEGAARVILTRPQGARARSPESYRELWYGRYDVQIIESAREALDRALESASGHVVVAGSLHLVGELRAHLNARFGVPSKASDNLFLYSDQDGVP